MTKVRSNVRMYGDLESEVSLAPLGTTLPTDLSIPADFEEVGWMTEDGVPFDRAVDVTKLKAWQGGTTLRVKITSDEKTFTFAAMEEKPLVTELYFGHEAPVVTGSPGSEIATMKVPESAGAVERAAVVKYVDGDVTKLYCFENIQITPNGEVPHTTADGTSYSFSAEVVGEMTIITNAPAYTETGSSS